MTPSPPDVPAQSHLVLAADGITDWRIIIAADAPPWQSHAAAELAHHLREITGACFPVLDESSPVSPNEIHVGPSTRWDRATTGLSALGSEGCVLRTGRHTLLIAGNGPRGTLYGVGLFLARHLGCRWFTPTVKRIPRQPRPTIAALDEVHEPAFEYREPYCFESMDPDWAVRNRCNGHFPAFGAEHGGGLRYALPFVHTFNEFVPVERHFDTHPEYFSEVGGQRLRHEAQLCLAHPAVFELVLAGVRERLSHEPGLRIISVSQNDRGNPCQCAACRAVDEAEGSFSGSLIRFVNRIAAAIEPDHPDVAIDTLAYRYTRKPPRVTRPRANVIVRLCTIECCFAHPLESCREKVLLRDEAGTGATFVEDLQAWSRICERLYVWDYVTNFANYVLPFPNLGVLAANLRLFARHHVKGVFAQGANPPGGGGEFAALRAWVLAQLMWDPAADESALIDEFLTGVYGRGGPAIRRYLDAFNRLVRDNLHLHASIYDRPDSDYLTPALLDLADRCFDEAEQLAADAEQLARIRHARLPVRFARIAQLPVDAPGREALINAFRADAMAAGITQLSEHIPLARTIDHLHRGVQLTHFARYPGGWSPFDETWPP
ncbi:MAG: DUF4838 domain-containing protein [Opitutaceae bacterium]|nr:DUF4838 domain-containing protein [Opitutaceae bacterium]